MADLEESRSTSEILQAAPDERGVLDIRTRAIQRIAERVVLETPGTVEHHRTLGRIVGSGTPKATITMEGRRARIAIDVAAAWPCNVTEIATRVRDRVLVETSRMSGISIRTVDVTLHVVDAAGTSSERRRVQ